ncbi:TPA: hypothetical protein MYJ98_005133 [Klebsiella pneumoniae]|nr:hypothetical protein [Klebsiella pneumoniae]HCB1017006.1 hypothetical protein [Klebsiella pneumoniae]
MRIRLLPGLKITLIATAILLMGVLAWLIDDNLDHRKALVIDGMTCESIINVHKDDEILSIRLKYSFIDGEGNATLSGTLRNGSQKLSRISRSVFFKYKHVNNTVYLANTNINTTLRETATSLELKDILPDFYIEKGAKTSFNIHPQKKVGMFL